MATVLLRPWGLLQDALVTSNELIMYFDHLKAILKLKSRGLDFRLRYGGPIYIVN